MTDTRGRILLVAVVLSATALAGGLWQSVAGRFMPWALATCIATFIPLLLAYLFMRGARSAKLRVITAAANFSFSALYLAAALSAFMHTGLLYWPAAAYPGFLAASLGAISLCVALQRPNNSFKPNPHQGGA